jgi:DNA-binding CsgD family transcriptional regulator
MERLLEEDVRAFADLAHEASWVARTEPRRLVPWTLSAVSTLVPNDSVLLIEGPAKGITRVESDNPKIAALLNSSEGREAWERLVDELPLRRQRLLRPFEFRALRRSDFLSQTEFRRLESYHTFFRPFGLAYVASVRYRGPRAFFDLATLRGSVDFAPRDLLLLDLFGAVLGAAARDPAPPPPRPLAELGLTAREAEVLERVARGRSNSEIAADLDIAAGTVKKHLDNVFAKLGVSNRIQATRAWLDATATDATPIGV